MSEIRFYKGKHRVKVVTESVGYLTVEALEDFEDVVGDEKITVKKGERRIVLVEDVHRQKTLPPMVKEHAYELEMEKELKRMVSEEETKKGRKKPKT
jgi:hypothetical protein